MYPLRLEAKLRAKLQPTTFLITYQQIKWLREQSKKTGLNQVEIVRRALDHYAETEEAKEQRRFFSPEQRENIKEVARRKGVAEIEVIRSAINRELRFMKKLYEKRKGS